VELSNIFVPVTAIDTRISWKQALPQQSRRRKTSLAVQHLSTVTPRNPSQRSVEGSKVNQKANIQRRMEQDFTNRRVDSLLNLLGDKT